MCGILYIIISKCILYHNEVYFFDILISKSRPALRCFVHFDLEMCFVPQQRALFRHLNFQKWSENGIFCTFWLGNVLRTTTACNFSWLRTRRFSEPTLLEKHNNSRLSYLFAHLHFLFSNSFSSLSFSLSNLFLLSASALFCFSSVHIIGNLISKFPLII